MTVKKILRTACIFLMLLAIALGSAACQTKKAANSSSDLEIFLWESGSGSDYMQKIVDAFKAKHPEYNVTFRANANGEYIDTQLEQTTVNTIDLFFTARGSDYEKYCEPLNDILDYTADGESKTIGEKFGEQKLQYLRSGDGNYYSLSYYGGLGGICYNADIIDGVAYSEPRTTDELYYLALDLSADKYVPFIHFTEGGYWDYVYNVWVDQYCGDAAYLDMLQNPTLEKLTDDENGIKQTLEVLHRLLGSTDNVYSGSNSYDFTSAQTLFLEGKAVMMVDGTWMEYEMRSNYEEGTKNFRMMKTPVISTIVEQCDSIKGENGGTADEELSALIAAIDAEDPAFVGDGYNVSQADYDRVEKARNTITNNYAGHTACIPNYSTAKDAAKEFLKFFYSDAAMKIYMEELKWYPPLDFSEEVATDQSSYTEWNKEQIALSQQCTAFPSDFREISHPIYSLGGCDLFGQYKDNLITLISTNDPNSKLTNAEATWTNIKTEHNKNWSRYFELAGITE